MGERMNNTSICMAGPTTTWCHLRLKTCARSCPDSLLMPPYCGPKATNVHVRPHRHWLGRPWFLCWDSYTPGVLRRICLIVCRQHGRVYAPRARTGPFAAPPPPSVARAPRNRHADWLFRPKSPFLCFCCWSSLGSQRAIGNTGGAGLGRMSVLAHI